MANKESSKKQSALFQKPAVEIWPDLPGSLKERADRAVLFPATSNSENQLSQSKALQVLKVPDGQKNPEDQFFTAVMACVGHLIGGSDQALDKFYDAVVEAFHAGISQDELVRHVMRRKGLQQG